MHSYASQNLVKPLRESENDPGSFRRQLDGIVDNGALKRKRASNPSSLARHALATC